jgi:hypothetical protein
LRQRFARCIRPTRLDERIDVAQPILPSTRVGVAGCLELRQGGRKLAHLQRQNTEIVVRIRVIGLREQDIAIEALGLRQLTGVVESDRLLQRRFRHLERMFGRRFHGSHGGVGEV